MADGGAPIAWEAMAEIRRSLVKADVWVVVRLPLGEAMGADCTAEDLLGEPYAAPQRTLKAWVLHQLEWAEFNRHRWVKVKGNEHVLELQVAWTGSDA